MYSARITRHNPTAFIILIDRSGSMEEKMQFGSEMTTKAEVVAIVTNMLISEMVNRCRKDDGIMDYFDIAAIGYGNDQVSMLLGSKENFIKPSVLAMKECRKETRTREKKCNDWKVKVITSELKYWIEPAAEGSTPMRAAMEQAYLMAARWCRKDSNNRSYHPTIINITDGEATDGDPEMLISVAEEIKSLKTADGNVLLINIDISAGHSNIPVLFPNNKEELEGSRYGSLLYDMSSVMPETYNDSILDIKPNSSPPFRGMCLNASASRLIAMMNIGSLSMNRTL